MNCESSSDKQHLFVPPCISFTKKQGGITMSYEESKKTQQRPHNIIMDDRKKLFISGVEEVESFDDAQVVLRTVCGNLVIKGSQLQIGKLSVDTGEVSVQGLVYDLSYEEVAASGSLWTRLFK